MEHSYKSLYDIKMAKRKRSSVPDFSKPKRSRTMPSSSGYGPTRFGMVRRKNLGRSPYLRRQLMDVGHSNTNNLSKITSIVGAYQALRNRTLYSFNAVNIVPQDYSGSGPFANRRDRDTIYLRGLKIYMAFRNRSNDNACLNIAVIAPREKTVSSISTTNFFRGDDNDGNRFVSFVNARSGLELSVLPINTDLYTVLYRTKVDLAARENNNLNRDEGVSSTFLFEKYIPINRQIRFNGTNSLPEDPIHIVYWMDRPTEDFGQTPSDSFFDKNHHVLQYWNEVV